MVYRKLACVKRMTCDFAGFLYTLTPYLNRYILDHPRTPSLTLRTSTMTPMLILLSRCRHLKLTTVAVTQLIPLQIPRALLSLFLKKKTKSVTEVDQVLHLPRPKRE